MANINKIELPDGTSYDLADLVSGYTTNTGTVTSVTINGGTGISVSGSPITTSGTITISLSGDFPSPTNTTPIVDGTADVGSETAYARGDHVHPSQFTISNNEIVIDGGSW